MTTPQERIAARMKERRLELGVSQETIGRRLNVTLRTYARWERCESPAFMARIGDLAKALETTEAELLGGEDPLTAQPSIEGILAKLDEVLVEVRAVRDDLGRRRR